MHSLRKVLLLLVNEVAPGFLSLSGGRLRSRLNLLDCGAALLSSRPLELFHFGLCSLDGLFRFFLRSGLRRLGRAGRHVSCS